MKFVALHFCAAVCALSAGIPAVGQAHDVSGALGSGTAATDFYLALCNDDGAGPPEKLFFQINGGAPATAPIVSAQLRKDGAAVNVADPVGGDSESSRQVEFPGGAGAYQLTVVKSRASPANYSFVFHCETASGEHTGTDISVLQNQ